MNIKIAIHKTDREGYFSNRWIEYCKLNSIPFKVVNCYSSQIIQDLEDCRALLWHFSHADFRDYQIAIKLITVLEASGKRVFPNLSSCWHFDDKVAQKYLLESIHAPLIESYVFYDKRQALEWAALTNYPKVFKLKGGASSANVKLVRSKSEAIDLINRSFGRGFRQFDRIGLFKDALRKGIVSKKNFKNLVLSFLKIFVKSDYEKVKGKERGYAYFQKFLPNNEFDIRIIIVGHRAFGIKRMVRKNDFRASGSGQILYDKFELNEDCVKIAFSISEKLKTNCLSYDFLFDEDGNPLIAEVSYGFLQDAYESCTGFWDRNLKWHEGSFNPQYWMVEDIYTAINTSNND